MDDRVEVNRRRWNEMARLHLRTYDIEAEDRGLSSLAPFELEELGTIDGKRICHLQCHIGGDSMVLARNGADVVGVDFSPEAIETATRRANEAGLSARLSFVLASVDEAPALLGQNFDIVYTSWGVLCWLPDINEWARSVSRLVEPGGFLYLAETHPYAQVIRWEDWNYGSGIAHYSEAQGDYSDGDAQFESPGSWEWSYGLGDVITALCDTGFRIDFLHEHTGVVWHVGDEENLSKGADGMWQKPGSSAPLSFSLRATNETVVG